MNIFKMEIKNDMINKIVVITFSAFVILNLVAAALVVLFSLMSFNIFGIIAAVIPLLDIFIMVLFLKSLRKAANGNGDVTLPVILYVVLTLLTLSTVIGAIVMVLMGIGMVDMALNPDHGLKQIQQLLD